MAYVGNSPSQQTFSPSTDYFNGDGVTVAFTLSRPVASVNMIQVVIENVPQNPRFSYTVAGNTLTFTSAPPAGSSNIYVYYTSPATQAIAPGQDTVGTTQLVNAAVTPAKLDRSYVPTTGSTVTGPLVIDTGYQSGLRVLRDYNINAGPAGQAIQFGAKQGTTPVYPVEVIGVTDTDGTAYSFEVGFNGTTAMSLTKTKTLNLPFGQIKFPATQNPSSNANTLDDYEEGFWTPTNGATPGITVNSINGAYYVKIGALVHAYAYFQITSTGTTGCNWGGLPFVCTSTYAPATRYYSNGGASFSNYCYIEPGTITFRDGGALPAGTYGVMVSATYLSV